MYPNMKRTLIRGCCEASREDSSASVRELVRAVLRLINGTGKLIRESMLSQAPVSNAIKGKPVRRQTLSIIRQTAARILAEQ